MSAQIADFNIRFNAESAKFQKDVDYAKKMLRGYTKEAKAANDSTGVFSQTLDVAGSGLKGIGGVATVTAGAIGLVTAGIGGLATASNIMVRETAQQAREIERMATVAQVTVEEIQALGYAAEQYSISGDKMADILKDVNDKLGDFVENEGGEFADFMNNIAPLTGLTIEKLQELSGPEALIAVKNAMDAVNVPMKSQLHYLESMADEASALMPLLENKGKRLHELKGHYDSLNVAMSKYDIEQYKQMDQQIADMELVMGKAFSNLSRQVTYALLPVMDDVTVFVRDLSTGVRDYTLQIQAMGKATATFNTLAGKSMRETHRELFADIVQLKDKIAEYKGVAYDSLPSVNPFGKSKNELNNLQRDLAMKQDQLRRINDTVIEQQKLISKGFTLPPSLTGEDDEDKNPRLRLPSSSEEESIKRQQEAGKSRLATLDNQYADELGKMRLAHETRLQQIGEMQLSEQEITRRGYDSLAALKAAYVDRENAHYDGEKTKFQQRREEEVNQTLTEWQQRLALQAAGEEAAATQEALAYVNRQTKLEEQFTAAMEQATGNQALEQELEAQYFATREALWDQHQGNLAKIEQDAAKARRMKQVVELRNYSDLFGNMAGVAEAFSGKQSGLYRGMFAASKAFAVAESIVKIQQGIASAAALPFPSNIPAMASVMSTTAGIVNTIKSTQMAGMAHNGIGEVPMIGGRVESNWTLLAGERVYTNHSAQQIDQMYNAIMAMYRQPFAANDPTLAFARQAAAMPRGGGVVLNLYGIPADARIEEKERDDGQTQVDVFLADMDADGPMAQAITRTFGTPRVGAG